MRLSRVHIDGLLESGTTVSLAKDISHYLNNVLRLRLDDRLLVFNSEQGEFLARVSEASKKSVELELLELRRSPQPPTLSINLLLGLSRGDRMDFAIQKSTELGVTEITPVYTEHGEVRLKPDRVEKKLQHWRKIAISACEQCGRLEIPTLHRPVPLTEAALASNANKWMLEPGGSDSLPQAVTDSHIEVLIGPEGGFSTTEIDWARTTGFKIVALGSRILRTETAPIAALAIIQHKFGDM
ncbi:MAG: 16S rRNA (uracil(1498)-N(3))-methyltransferase [Pseudohongiellaceae bacterium]